MRVCYGQPRRLLELDWQLEERRRVHYIPMEYVKRGEALELVPAVNNLVFIQTHYDDLLALKQENAFKYLRFIMRPVPGTKGEEREVIWVRDREMEDFMRVASEYNQQVMYLNNMDFALRPGARVQVKEGVFAGVQGIVKSIKKHLCVVLPVDKLVAVAILNVPKKSLIYLEDK